MKRTRENRDTVLPNPRGDYKKFTELKRRQKSDRFRDILKKEPPPDKVNVELSEKLLFGAHRYADKDLK